MDDKGSGDNWLYFASGNGKPQSYLIYFRDKGMFELSVIAPRQRQIFVKRKLSPGKWYHLAFTWSAPKGEVALYINGAKVASKQKDKWKNPDFKLSAPLNIWLGQAGADRFRAKVGEGDYDNIRIYEKQLSDDEILVESIGGAASDLVTVPMEKIIRENGMFEVSFSAPVPRFNMACPLRKRNGVSDKLSWRLRQTHRHSR